MTGESSGWMDGHDTIINSKAVLVRLSYLYHKVVQVKPKRHSCNCGPA